MSDEFKQTIRILRKPKPGGGDSDRNVWSDPVDTIELELVSTVMLKKVLSSNDDSAKRKIEQAFDDNRDTDGLLAHDPASGSYQIVDDQGNDEFSLVTTQMLHRILKKDDPEAGDGELDDLDTGFDPYNTD